MNIVETILLIFLVLDALALTVLVLLQQSRGAEIGAAFGSGSSSTMFGSSRASGLVKVTAVLAIVFFIITFGLAYIAAERAAEIRGFDQFSDDAVEELTLPDPSASGDTESGEAVEGDDLPMPEGDAIPGFETVPVEDADEASAATDVGG